MRVAVFTIAQNEPYFLPFWLKAYTRHLHAEDIYVLDHNSTGDAADVLTEACQNFRIDNVLRLTYDKSYDSQWLTMVTRKFQQYLLQDYDYVLFSAVDEIVLPNNGMSLTTFAQQATDDIIIPHGYEIVHKKDEEPEIEWNLGQSLVKQRKFCYDCRRYSKPLFASRPVFWSQGWIEASNVPKSQPVDSILRLLHLHRIDYNTCLRTHREKNARQWNPEERKQGVFRHNMVEEPEMLSRWMLCHSDNPANYAELSEIPDYFKEFC